MNKIFDLHMENCRGLTNTNDDGKLHQKAGFGYQNLV